MAVASIDPLPERQRIIQLHPTLRCNLRCAHCYSNSSPEAGDGPALETLCAALSDAAALGYRAVAISGGEPLLHVDLEYMLRHARACGLRTTITTNGTLLTSKRLSRLVDCLDLLAISLDGPPEIHNELRQSRRAFDALCRGVAHVRETGLPFGFIHTVTRRSWEHLLWTAEFAAAQGAQLLQLHPLEPTGRAQQGLRDAVLDDDLLTRVYLLSLALGQQYDGTLAIQFDAFRKDLLRDNPEIVYASDWSVSEGEAQWQAADLLGLMVVEADGTVVPVSYGLSHAYKICNVREQRLIDVWPTYVRDGYGAFRALCRMVFGEVTTPCALPFFDWHAMLVTRSHERWLRHGRKGANLNDLLE